MTEEVSHEIPEEAPSPAACAEARDEFEQLWVTARRELTPAEFQVFWLRRAEGASVSETVRLTHLTRGHVNQIVYVALAKLRSFLDR